MRSEARGTEECELAEMSISVKWKRVFDKKPGTETDRAIDDGRNAEKLRPWIEYADDSADE